MPPPPKQIMITREEPRPQELEETFAARHPDAAYVLGPTIRALYLVGCLAVDLLAPLQVVELLPGQELFAAMVLVPAFLGLAYLEYRLFRRLWPPRRGRNVLEAVGARRV